MSRVPVAVVKSTSVAAGQTEDIKDEHKKANMERC
jgi:hypothetical protein